MKLDPIDLIILKELSQDGRASLRTIAKKSSLSTPTVSSRFQRMKRAGLIQKFVPVFNLDVSENSGVIALVNLRVPVSSVPKVVNALARRPEVCSLFVTTGESNLTVKVNMQNSQALQHFLTSTYVRKLGAEVTGNQIITETVKDDHPLPLAGEFRMKLHCDLCKGEITTNRPYSLKVASTRYYFCCKTCRSSYLEKHRARIMSVNRSSTTSELP